MLDVAEQYLFQQLQEDLELIYWRRRVNGKALHECKVLEEHAMEIAASNIKDPDDAHEVVWKVISRLYKKIQKTRIIKKRY